MGGCHIHSVDHLVGISGLLNGLGQHGHGLGSGFSRRGIAAVLTGIGGAFTEGLGQQVAQAQIDLAEDSDRLSEGFSTHGHHTEFLEFEVITGVDAAVDHTGLGNRQDVGVGVEIFIEGKAARGGSGLGYSKGNTEDGIGPEFRFVIGAVKLDHSIIDLPLSGGIHAAEAGIYDVLDIADGLADSLAPVARITVPQFLCLVGAGGGAAGDVGPSPEFICHAHIGTDCGSPPVIDDFMGFYRADFKSVHVHGFSFISIIPRVPRRLAAVLDFQR